MIPLVLHPYVDGFAETPATVVNPLTAKTQKITALLDSGSARSSIDRDVAAAIGAVSVGSAVVVGAGGRPFTAPKYRLNILTPVGDVINHVFWGIPPGVGLGALIGGDILRPGVFLEVEEGWYAAIGTAAPYARTLVADAALILGVAGAVGALAYGMRRRRPAVTTR